MHSVTLIPNVVTPPRTRPGEHRRRGGTIALVLATTIMFAAGAVAQTASVPMGYADARHLLMRTGFGPTDAEVRTFAVMSREQAVSQLLQQARTTATTPPPAFALEPASLRGPDGATASDDERREFRRRETRRGLDLRAWWVQEMLATSSPLTERMTLFWHNHFVSSQQKVRFARPMYLQNALLRANALGHFDTMLHAVAKDPAMLIYLDGAQNRRGQPNENFAREVMELFTLGEGHYTEQDVKEAARAYTGWSVDRDTGEYLLRVAQHDAGMKSVLGASGRFAGDDVLDVILAQPQTAEFICAKLWREFVSPDPDLVETQRIATVFRAQRYDIAAAMRALLTSAAFWAGENRATLVRSPVELVVGTLRQLDVPTASALPFAVVATGMGQNLFSPPNVKGWPGGNAWINSTTLLARKQFLDRLARADATPASAQAGMTGEPPSPATGAANATMERNAAASEGADDDKARAARFATQIDRSLRSVQFNAVLWAAQRPGATTAARMQSIQSLLLPLPPVPPEGSPSETDVLAFVRATLLDPAYQLK